MMTDNKSTRLVAFNFRHRRLILLVGALNITDDFSTNETFGRVSFPSNAVQRLIYKQSTSNW